MTRPSSDLPGGWVILGCGAKKRPEPALAIDLYTGPHYALDHRWAESVTTPDRILILSAKYGLIDSRTVIEPYDVTFRSAHAIDQETLASQAEEFGLRGPIITVASALYRQRLRRATGGRVQPYNPHAEAIRADGKTPGIGRLNQSMARSLGTVPAGPPTALPFDA